MGLLLKRLNDGRMPAFRQAGNDGKMERWRDGMMDG